MLNRILINKLKDRDDIDSVWTQNGSIWCRPLPNGKKYKMQIGDNIEKKLKLKPLPVPATPEDSDNDSPRRSNYSTGLTPPITTPDQ